MKRLHAGWIGLFGFLLTSSAEAVPCTYAAYTPPAVYQVIVGKLAAHGFAVVPSGFGMLWPTMVPGRDIVLRGNVMVGQIAFESVTRLGTSNLLVFDAQGHSLASLIETSFPCPPGLCRQTDFTTSLDASSVNSLPPFRIVDVEGAVEHYRYGDETGVTTWRYGFGESFQWLMTTLLEGQDSVSLLGGSRLDQLGLQLAADPAILPYLPYISIADRGDWIVASGRLPYTVYNLVVNRAIDMGLWNLRMDVVTDSGLRPVVYNRVPYLECFPW